MNAEMRGGSGPRATLPRGRGAASTRRSSRSSLPSTVGGRDRSSHLPGCKVGGRAAALDMPQSHIATSSTTVLSQRSSTAASGLLLLRRRRRDRTATPSQAWGASCRRRSCPRPPPPLPRRPRRLRARVTQRRQPPAGSQPQQPPGAGPAAAAAARCRWCGTAAWTWRPGRLRSGRPSSSSKGQQPRPRSPRRAKQRPPAPTSPGSSRRLQRLLQQPQLLLRSRLPGW
jgi:hypothetical protein